MGLQGCRKLTHHQKYITRWQIDIPHRNKPLSQLCCLPPLAPEQEASKAQDMQQHWQPLLPATQQLQTPSPAIQSAGTNLLQQGTRTPALTPRTNKQSDFRHYQLQQHVRCYFSDSNHSATLATEPGAAACS